MRYVLTLIALLLLTAAAPRVGPAQLCQAEAPPNCTPMRWSGARFAAPEVIIQRTVTVPAAAIPLERPLTVRLIAMASAEVRWNGVVIGRNGMPGPTRARERPGLFVASFVVPRALVRPGTNTVAARLSSHHLWLPVQSVVHQFWVEPYRNDELPGLASYLPALLALGALAAAGVYFLVAATGERRDRGALLLALVACAAVLQLVLEVSRAFVAYTYPWHLARIGAIALVAAVTATLIAGYAARRFAPERTRAVVLAIATTAGLSVLLAPGYDLKAIGAAAAGFVGLGACAAQGVRRRLPGAWIALAAAVLVLPLLAWRGLNFLDREYYLLLAGLLVALTAEQVGALRGVQAAREAEAVRADALEERLRRAERDGDAIVVLREGTRAHRVAERDILYLRAADDYAEAILVDGRQLLVTTTLARLLAAMPDRFARVHKSYAVNRDHVSAVANKPGGGKVLRVSDGSILPVGRTFAAGVAAWKL